MYRLLNMLQGALSASLVWLLMICSAHAVETVSPDAQFPGENHTYEGAGEAMKSRVDALCATNNAIKGCHGSVTGTKWSVGSNSWIWYGKYGYTHKGITPDKDVVVSDLDMSGNINYICPPGWVLSGDRQCTRNDMPTPLCDTCDAQHPAPSTAGGTVDLTAGANQQSETDYRNASGTLEFTRTYRSDVGEWRHNYQNFAVEFSGISGNRNPDACFLSYSGTKPHCFSYTGRGTASGAAVKRANGRMVYFGDETGLSPGKDINDRVTQLFDENGVKSGLRVENSKNGDVETYNMDGLMLTREDRKGRRTTFTYSDNSTPGEIADKFSLLLTVTDHFGQQLKFTYVNGGLATMTDPMGRVYTYQSNAEADPDPFSPAAKSRYSPLRNQLGSVIYPDGAVRKYIYNEQSKTGNTYLPTALTGIVDENEVRSSTFTYNPNGVIIATEKGVGLDKHTISYTTGSRASPVSPLGAQYRHNYAAILGAYRSSGFTQPGADGVGTVSASYSYDDNGNLSNFTDVNGAQTNYVYDLSRNLEISRVEAAGTTLARTVTTEWHPSHRLPTRIAEPLRITSMTYDTRGNMLTKSVQGTNDVNGSQKFNGVPVGLARVSTFTYSDIGQLLTEKGPRSDVNDTTSYAYDTAGNLISITNALGHITSLSNYDADGRVGRITDPNGLITDLTYTVRGKLATRTVGGLSTSYEYMPSGQLATVTFPGGNALSYTYDAAYRLTGIADSSGNSIAYTLDGAGNRTLEETKDTSGALTRQISRVYDILNRLKQVTGAL